MMNKKGQLDYPIITFVVIVFGLILLGPIMLKVFSSIQAPFNDALLNQTDGGVAAAAGFNKVMDTSSRSFRTKFAFTFHKRIFDRHTPRLDNTIHFYQLYASNVRPGYSGNIK